MHFFNLLKAAVGTCPLCDQKAGILSREHSECRRVYDDGWEEMVRLAAQAAASQQFDEKTLRLSLADIAKRCYGDGTMVNQALEEGWKHGVGHAMSDGVLTQDEEVKIREFRDRLALDKAGADPTAATQLERASRNRITFDARLAALAVQDQDTQLLGLMESLRDSRLTQEQRTNLLI